MRKRMIRKIVKFKIALLLLWLGAHNQLQAEAIPRLFLCVLRETRFARKWRNSIFYHETRFFPRKLEFPAILRKFYITKYNLT